MWPKSGPRRRAENITVKWQQCKFSMKEAEEGGRGRQREAEGGRGGRQRREAGRGGRQREAGL